MPRFDATLQILARQNGVRGHRSADVWFRGGVPRRAKYANADLAGIANGMVRRTTSPEGAGEYSADEGEDLSWKSTRSG